MLCWTTAAPMYRASGLGELRAMKHLPFDRPSLALGTRILAQRWVAQCWGFASMPAGKLHDTEAMQMTKEVHENFGLCLLRKKVPPWSAALRIIRIGKKWWLNQISLCIGTTWNPKEKSLLHCTWICGRMGYCNQGWLPCFLPQHLIKSS